MRFAQSCWGCFLASDTQAKPNRGLFHITIFYELFHSNLDYGCCGESFSRMWRSFLRLQAITFSAHSRPMFIFSGLKIYIVNSQSVGLHLSLLVNCARQKKFSWTDDQGWSPLAQHQQGGSLLRSLDNVWKLFKLVPNDLKTLDDTSITRIVGERLNCKSRIILLTNS